MKKVVTGSGSLCAPTMGEPARLAPQAAFSVRGRKIMRCGCQWPAVSVKNPRFDIMYPMAPGSGSANVFAASAVPADTPDAGQQHHGNRQDYNDGANRGAH